MKRYFAAILVAILTAAAIAVGQVSTNPRLTGVFGGMSVIGMPVIGASSGQVLYADSSSNLAGSSNLTFNGSQLAFAAGTVGAPSFYFSTDTTSGYYRPSANQIGISISGTQRGLWSSSGLTITGALAPSDTSTTRSNLGQATLTQPLVDYGGLNLNGTTTYLDGNALTGIADGKKGTVVIFVRFANASGTEETLMYNTGAAFRLRRTAGGGIRLSMENAAGTTIFDQSLTSVVTSAGTYVIMLSWDMAAAQSTVRMYVNDATGTITNTTYTDDTIDYTVTEWSVGADVAGGTPITGDIYLVYFDSTTAQDFSTQSVRRKYADANNVPQFLGRNCDLPTGSTPILCLAYDSAAQWPINRGSAQTTTFTQNGTIAAATTALSGQWAPREALGNIKTVTGDYTVLTTDKTIINNRAATNTLTLPTCSNFKNRTLRIVTIQAQAVNSAASNVVPRTGGAAGTAILGATDGAWADLECDGTNWLSTAGSFLDLRMFMPEVLRDSLAANDSTYAMAA